jgi:pimeloyl-ACP methyl ester carboxylesterase
VSDLAAVALRVTLSNRLAVTAVYAAMVSNGRWPEREIVDRLTSHGGRLVEGGREATRALVEASRAPDAFHRRRLRYGGPVYAIWGDRDRLVPASHSNGVRTAFPHARIAVWKRMGHLPARDRMEDLITVITRAAAPSAGIAARQRAAHRRNHQRSGR